MKNKNILALVLVLCISLSMMGCGKTNTKDNTKNVVAVNVIKQIVFTEEHIEEYLRLMVVLACVLI